MTRRDFLSAAATGLGGVVLGSSGAKGGAAGQLSDQVAALYKKFLDPDRRFSIRPFWFWNGKLSGDELGRQIRQMVAHGVYGAYAHNRDGLQTPYLSEEWWGVVGQALSEARAAGFNLCLVDEFEWPSGEARDYWLPGINKSRVVAANPAFQMRRLRPSETVVEGPRRVRIPLPERAAAVVVGRRLGQGRLDGSTLRTLSFEPGTRELAWDAPEGEWVVFTYGVELTIGQPDHGTVDLMSRDAVAKFIEIYYEEFHRRYGEYFGKTFSATFADHEGTYGTKLPWTPRLFKTFRKKIGYALEPYLPALTYEIGPKTEKVRCDLLDTISELYSENFFGQVRSWCEGHGLEYSGHVWEESMFWSPAVQGDFYRILRSMTHPGCDTLVEWGRQSVWLKEVASVAEFEGKRLVCENQGVQGSDSSLSLEGMRRVSNCLGAWNVSEFIPHAFDYDLTRINYPPDWFASQPYLPWFRFYADQMRRVSFINSESHHVADLLLLYPQVSIWGQSAPAFINESLGFLRDGSNWSEDARETSDVYADLKLRLTEERFDYLVADDHYLAQSRVEGKRLRIEAARFATLLLPPMSTTRRSTAEHVRDFLQAGGTVIALRRLPGISVEAGRDDPQLRAIWDEAFDTRPTLEPFLLRRNSAGGRAYFVPRSVPDAIEVVRETAEPDVELLEGPRDHLYVLHKKKEGVDLYWVVNDTAEPRTNLLRFRAAGRAERWDAATGQREPLFCQNQGLRTVVRLVLQAWDAAYVVFDPAAPPQTLRLSATNFDELHVVSANRSQVTVRGRALLGPSPLFAELSGGQQRFRGEYRPPPAPPLEIGGEWKVTVEAPLIPLPYARAKNDPEDRGLHDNWARPGKEGLRWRELWISPMNRSIRRWNVIGPFPNPEDRGLEETYPPERNIDTAGVYDGDEGEQIRWQLVDGGEEVVEHGGHGWDWAILTLAGGPYGASSHVVNYGKVLRMTPLRGTIYAQTYLSVPEERDAVLVLATPSPAGAFLNGTKVYSRWVRPLYFDFTDGFATRISARLRAGWNSLLLKFLHNPDNAKSPQFTCRVEERGGSAIPGLLASPRVVADASAEKPGGFRWLQFPVPVVAGALRVPPLRQPCLAFVDGKQVPTAQAIDLPRGTRTVTLRVAAEEALDGPFAFSPVPASMPLGTWKVPGLENFSGQMTYEKTVEIPRALLAEKVLLDCGLVAVAAEAWVNGQSAGSRAWPPYVFDVGPHLRPGPNQLKVRVANTEGNARAVGLARSNLDRIDLDGWHGPARLVPYVETEVVCQRA